MPSNADANEQERLTSLDRYDVLDTPQEEAFDRITRLARRFFDVPISTIGLIDGHRLWFKSRQGDGLSCEAPKSSAFCTVAIQQTAPLVVEDMLQDERFRTNPFVVSEPHIRFYAGVPLRTPDGDNIGTLCVIDNRPRAFGAEQVEVLSDLAQIVMSELELRRLATTDGLTGALSRRAFREEAGRTVALALRHGYDLSCIVFDLDHFKAINDANGHATGDVVLIDCTAICRAELRKSDLLGRIGGEEFAILLPHTDRAAALEVAEKLRTLMERQRVAGPFSRIRFSASFGVAALERAVPDVETLMNNADSALYAAKAAGRNRCAEWRAPENRKPNPRRRVFKAGRIAFNGGRSTIDCTVRSLSDRGASLDVISSASVPATFNLRVESDDLSHACRVVAKKDKSIEVEFAAAT